MATDTPLHIVNIDKVPIERYVNVFCCGHWMSVNPLYAAPYHCLIQFMSKLCGKCYARECREKHPCPPLTRRMETPTV